MKSGIGVKSVQVRKAFLILLARLAIKSLFPTNYKFTGFNLRLFLPLIIKGEKQWPLWEKM